MYKPVVIRFDDYGGIKPGGLDATSSQLRAALNYLIAELEERAALYAHTSILTFQLGQWIETVVSDQSGESV